MLDMRRFGFFRPKELAPGREIEKQLTHLQACSGGAAGFFDFDQFAADMRKRIASK